MDEKAITCITPIESITCITPIESNELLHRYLNLDRADFSVAERVAETTLFIPLFPAMSDADGEYIAQAPRRYN